MLRPEPGFYIANVINGEIVFLVGDLQREAYSKTRAQIMGTNVSQVMMLERERVYESRVYVTEATVGGKDRSICIESWISGDDPRLCFYVDDKRVLQIKHLRWKFRGNWRIRVDEFSIHVSWDVHSRLFEDDGYALYIFKFGEKGGG
ncbi:unnamed protein product [Cuscuta campestris]|uniref:Uncharacterized protein n=1 Tax=Cuscuta campestris TaxID=132261 RepID=A0A484L0N0_9ASTE|nr:unnamed protein product [Cuscuta campestris]